MTLLRSIAICSLTLLAALLYWVPLLPASALLLPLPAETRRHLARKLLLGFGLFTVRVAWRPFFRVRYSDRSGGAREPGIIAVNHRAATDAFLVSLPHLSAAQTVNGWPLRLPFIGWMAKFAGYLDITGWEYDKLKSRAAAILAHGDMILSYPEGTRSESKTMNPFHSGIFQVARELEVPVYMLCIAGNQHMPDRRFRFREFRDLSVRLLPPIPRDAVKRSASAYALRKEVFRIMESELAEMDDELERELRRSGAHGDAATASAPVPEARRDGTRKDAQGFFPAPPEIEESCR